MSFSRGDNVRARRVNKSISFSTQIWKFRQNPVVDFWNRRVLEGELFDWKSPGTADKINK
jgi:hypothetical protein